MKKNKYLHMLNLAEMWWKIMGELKWSPKVMSTPKIKERACSNKIEFLALNEKVGYLEIRICEVNAHLGGFEIISGGDFCGKFPHMGYHPYTLVFPS